MQNDECRIQSRRARHELAAARKAKNTGGPEIPVPAHHFKNRLDQIRAGMTSSSGSGPAKSASRMTRERVKPETGLAARTEEAGVDEPDTAMACGSGPARQINHRDTLLGESAEFLWKVLRGLMAKWGIG